MNKEWLFSWSLALLCLAAAGTAMAGSKKSYRKVQEVNFEAMNLKGSIRNPEGAYLVQKKGLKFMPLYQVQKDFDAKIRKGTALID